MSANLYVQYSTVYCTHVFGFGRFLPLSRGAPAMVLRAVAEATLQNSTVLYRKYIQYKLGARTWSRFLR